MDMKQAMSERHMVRKYTDKPISIEVAQEINEHLSDVNAKYSTDIQLIRDDNTAFNAAIKLVLAKGVRNYFILAGKAAPDLRERLGMAGADLMLFCQTLRLNTWWVGGTYSHAKMAQKAPGDEVIGIIAVGYVRRRESRTSRSLPKRSRHTKAPNPNGSRMVLRLRFLPRPLSINRRSR